MIDQTQEHLDASKTDQTMVTGLVGDLVAALINVRIYWIDHPRVLESTRTVQRQLAEICRRRSTGSITLAITRDFLVFEDRPLLGASLSAARFIKSLQEWDAGGIRLRADAVIGDFEILLCAINDPKGEGESYEKINALLREGDGESRITLLPVYRELEGTDGSFSVDPERGKCSVPLHLYQSMMDLLEGITVSVSTGGLIDFEGVQEHAEVMLRRLENNEGPLVNLAMQDQYDAFTFGHSVRVSVLALNFGRSLTKDTGTLLRLGTAALLHDVGKALVPFDVLHSNKPLSAEERREISRHPEYGAQILMDHEDSDDCSIAATFGHHCSHAKAGYPKTVHEHRVSRITEIVGIVDVFEALTAARPYKRPMSPVRAYRIMMDMRDKFDLGLLRRFIEVNGVYPCGQLLELSSGELARVQSQSSELCAPKVKIITDREQNHLDAVDQRVADLSRQEGSDPVTVVRYLGEKFSTLIATD